MDIIIIIIINIIYYYYIVGIYSMYGEIISGHRILIGKFPRKGTLFRPLRRF